MKRPAAITVTLALCLTLGSVAVGFGEDGPSYVGKALSDVLAELQKAGLNIIYSSAVVRPEMVIRIEPTSGEPRAMLDEILAPHGLRLQEASGGQLIVVEAELPGVAALQSGSIQGRVEVEGDPSIEPVVIVRLVEGNLESTVSSDGRFSFEDLPAGEYTVEVFSSETVPQRISDVTVFANGITRVQFSLRPISVFLEEIVVVPSHFRILEDKPESRQFLSRQEVEQMPHIADDLYRAVKRLPGAAGGDYSAKFNVRGGEQDEILVVLDGVELHEPFHLKDFQNMFSTVDAEAVGGVDFLTGGYPAEYGDRMSGVMDISTVTGTGENISSVALSTLNARLYSEGRFNSDRGRWLVTARGWYPAAILESSGATREDLLTDYYDLLAKVDNRVGAKSWLSANILLAYDDLTFETRDADESERVKALYRSYDFWLNLRSDWKPALFSQTVLAAGRIKRDRTGTVIDIVEGTRAVDDQRDFGYVALRQDWSYTVSDRHFLKWGVNLKFQDSEYDYWNERVVTDPDIIGDGDPIVDTTEILSSPNGQNYGAYLAHRFQPIDRVFVELGLRWDHQTFTAESQLSPRVNLMYEANPRTKLRFAWGRFQQSQRLNELLVEDGDTQFYSAQRAEHWLASLERSFANGLALRIEAYYKDLSELRPRYENLFNPIDIFPELDFDRIRIAPERGLAKGIELLLKDGSGRSVSWWLSYSLATAEDRIDGSWQLRSWDQRHAVSLGLNLKLPRRWNFNFAGTFHSGWPTTDVTAEVVDYDDEGEAIIEESFGPRNGIRFSDYRRLDMRASKTWQTRRGEIALLVDVINLLNRKNPCCVDDLLFEVEEDGSVTVIREEGYWAPIIPSIGVRWRF